MQRLLEKRLAGRRWIEAVRRDARRERDARATTNDPDEDGSVSDPSETMGKSTATTARIAAAPRGGERPRR
jgi:hypothetical protein